MGYSGAEYPFINDIMGNSYKERYAKIWSDATRLDIHAEMHNEFTFFSANLEHFLPLVPLAEHESLFKQSVAYHRMGALDLTFGAAGYIPPLVGWDVQWLDKLRSQPGIIASAHTGTHLLIAVLMAKASIPFVLLAAGHLINRLKRIWKDIIRAFPGSSLPRVVDASSPWALRRLIEHAQAGTNVLVYWDGQQGAVGLDQPGKRVSVPFLGQHLLLRRGIAFVAHTAGVPIYPLVCFRQRDQSVACFHRSAVPACNTTFDRFADYALQAISAHFASLLIHFPAQWYNWTQLQHQVSPNRYTMESGRELSSGYGILKGQAGFFLFDKKNYHAMALADDHLACLESHIANG